MKSESGNTSLIASLVGDGVMIECCPMCGQIIDEYVCVCGYIKLMVSKFVWCKACNYSVIDGKPHTTEDCAINRVRWIIES